MKKLIKYILFLLVIILCIYYFYPETKLDSNAKIDYILVKKSERKMEVYQGKKLLKTYKISLGRNPKGTKEFEGDMKTPEGIYTINDKNPNSGYYKNLGISYPEKQDIIRSEKLGKPTGGDVKIHGIRNYMGIIGKFQRFADWTHGCIAVTNNEMEELYNSTIIGAKIEIKP